MGHSVLEIPRTVRCRLKRLAQKPSEHGRRVHAILFWETGNCMARVARGLCAARSSVQRWRALFEEYGEQGLRPLKRGRSEWKANDKALESFAALTDSSPRDHGDLILRAALVREGFDPRPVIGARLGTAHIAWKREQIIGIQPVRNRRMTMPDEAEAVRIQRGDGADPEKRDRDVPSAGQNSEAD